MLLLAHHPVHIAQGRLDTAVTQLILQLLQWHTRLQLISTELVWGLMEVTGQILHGPQIALMGSWGKNHAPSSHRSSVDEVESSVCSCVKDQQWSLRSLADDDSVGVCGKPREAV
jgi:hypothetical protein